MTVKEYFKHIGFDLIEENTVRTMYEKKELNYKQIIKFINGWQTIDCYWEDKNGVKQPFTFTITQKLYHAILKQRKELGWI